MKSEILNNLSALSFLDAECIQKLFDLETFCICDDVLETVLASEEKTEIDIGIGTLIITFSDSELHYKFIPSAKLREGIIDAIKNKVNILETEIEDNLKQRLSYIYKDLF